MVRNVIAYRDDFLKFYLDLDKKTQLKIEYVIDLVRFEKNVPRRFFKYLENTNGIFEIIIVSPFRSIRILCFFDGLNIVITNCFIKKQQRTPKSEIWKAEKLKQNYLEDKYGIK